MPASRWNRVLCRYSGRWSQYLLITTSMRAAPESRLFSTMRSGAGAVLTVKEHEELTLFEA